MYYPKQKNALFFHPAVYSTLCSIALANPLIVKADVEFLPNKSANQFVLDRVFKRTPTFGRENNLFQTKSQVLLKRDALPVKKAPQPIRASGWNTKSVLISQDSTHMFGSRTARLTYSRSHFTARSYNIGKDRFPVPEMTQFNIKPATGFSNNVEPPEYRGRLPTEAVKALEEIKQRQLTIQQVRSLLNKNKRPE
jgi:hypothetical protein